MMSDSVLPRLKDLLRATYRNRLRGVVLYGSEARHEASQDSDIDLLVLLDGPVSLGRDLEDAIKAVYPLQLEFERPIHLLPVDVKDYEAGEFAVYRLAKVEGIVT